MNFSKYKLAPLQKFGRKRESKEYCIQDNLSILTGLKTIAYN